MALSQKNIEKLHMKGIYRCEPVLKWLPSYKRDNPYWCKNWTFQLRQNRDGDYYMYDTYWSTGDDYPVKLTDENFDQFEFLFDLDDIQYVNSYESWLEYPREDRWCVALDSGGIQDAKCVVRKGANKIKERVVERIEREIESLKRRLSNKERDLERIINGEVTNYDWI